MGIRLEKYGTINLSKEAPNISGVTVGLGWDPVKGFSSSIDCDAAVCLVRKGGLFGSKKEIIYFGNRFSADKAVRHTGDNLTGDGDGDDEQIIIDLAKVDPAVEKIYIGVNIYSAKTRGQHFGKVQNCFVRLVDNRNGNEVCRYDISNNAVYDRCVSMIMGVLERVNGSEFKFTAMGEGQGNSNVKSMFDGLK